MTDITALEPFRRLSETSHRLLTGGTVTHRFDAGRTIIEKGQDVSGAYFVLEGRLRVFSLLPGGKEATLYLLEPGETCVLALNSLFNDLLYPAWVQTDSDTRVAVIPGRVYRALFATEPDIQDLTVQTLSTLVFRLMAELDQVHGQTLEQRLAGLLLVRASGRGVVRLTQQEMASHIGTTREVVARLIGRLSTRGLIQSGRGAVTLHDRHALSVLAGGQDG